MKPAIYVLKILGGPTKAAQVLGLTKSAVHHWITRGGLVPAKHQRLVLKYAQLHGLDISSDDLILGRMGK